MQVLIWLLIIIDGFIVAACARLNHRSRRDPVRLTRVMRPMALALVAAGLLPLPALLSTDAPAAAWGLWGATTIAAGLTWAFADTLRTMAALPPHRRAHPPGSGLLGFLRK